MWHHPAATLDLSHLSPRSPSGSASPFSPASLSPLSPASPLASGRSSPAAEWSAGASAGASTSGGGGAGGMKNHNVKKELKLDANERWNEALKRMKEEAGYNNALEGRNDARARWARGTLYAHHLAEATGPARGGFDSTSDSDSDSSGEDAEAEADGDGDGDGDGDEGSGEGLDGPDAQEGSEGKEEHAWTKHLEELHYLEMIDPKHRYGSNLKYYHRRWIDSPTEDNFFKWLDRGAGAQLSLPECPRQHLERATVRYLTPEQRVHYLAEVDGQGRLRWAHNSELVDTTPGRWEDAGEGRGVEPTVVESDSPAEAGTESEPSSSTPPTPASEPNGPPGPEDDPGNSSSSSSKAEHSFRQSLTEHLLRKTLARRLHRDRDRDRRRRRPRRDTWIYVASQHYDLYVGIKCTGSFQHSSFLAGGVISSAGTITVKDGLIQSLNPLSGHYRTSIEHFKSFVTVMEKRGADLSKVSISKAVASLWGAQQATKLKHLRSSLAHMPRSGIRSLQHAMQMTPIFPPPSSWGPGGAGAGAGAGGHSPYGASAEDYDEERMARRREALYGRAPSDKAKKSLESVVEVPEPEEDLPEQGGWV